MSKYFVCVYVWAYGLSGTIQTDRSRLLLRDVDGDEDLWCAEDFGVLSWTLKEKKEHLMKTSTSVCVYVYYKACIEFNINEETFSCLGSFYSRFIILLT